MLRSIRSSLCGLLHYFRLAFVLLAMIFGEWSIPASAQTYSFNAISGNAQPGPATDGTNVVTIDAAGNIVVIPFDDSTATTLVPAGVTLPNGVGTSTGFTALGPPSLINNVVYFGAQSATGSGYYSIPVSGGAIHAIADSKLQTSSGLNVTPAALPQELNGAGFINYYGLPVPGIGSNLFLSATGDATFTASLPSSTNPQGNLAIMNLSHLGSLSSIIESDALSGCTRISNFATDGNIIAVWAISSSKHLLLLENNTPSLTCSNVLLDLGAPGASATGILPGQPSNGSIMENYVAPSTVIDSGYIYFSATLKLDDATINAGIYSGLFRLRPGGAVEKVLATDNVNLGTTGSVGAGSPGPLAIYSSFAVRGNYVVVATGWLTHYSWGGGLHPVGLFFYNQASATLRKIAAAGEPLTPTQFFYIYEGAAPTEAGLSADGKFAFELTVSDIPAPTVFKNYPVQFTVNLLTVGTTTTLTSSGSPSTYGSPITLTATVTSTGSSSPTGNITFYDGTTSLGSAAVDSSGKAALTLILAGGNHALKAKYVGDTANGPSTGSAAVLVNQATTQLNVTSSASNAVALTPITLTATALSIPGAASPTGSVTFRNGSAILGTSNLDATGKASLSINNLSVGAASVNATYAGDANYSSLVSPPITINVSAASTSSVLSASVATATAGTAVTFTALVTASQGTPSGTVTFSSNGVALGTGAVSSGGSAILAVTNLPIGVNQIQAVYGGNAFFPPSTSGVVSVSISGTPSFTVSSTAPSLTIPQGGTGSVVISLAPVGGFIAPTQFSCAGLPQHATCTFAPPSITPTLGASAVTTTLTISTNVQTSELRWPARISYAGFLLLTLSGFGLRRSGRQRLSRVFSTLLMATVLYGVVGCGGNSAPSIVTPEGTATVIVTANSGSTTQSTNIMLTIAPK